MHFLVSLSILESLDLVWLIALFQQTNLKQTKKLFYIHLTNVIVLNCVLNFVSFDSRFMSWKEDLNNKSTYLHLNVNIWPA